MNKKIILGIIILAILSVIIYFVKTEKKFGGVISTSTYPTASSSKISISAGQDARAVATSSRRARIEITNDCSSVVYLVLNNDIKNDTGLRLNANGGSFTLTPEAMYTGSIRATSSAACDINVHEGTF